MENQLSELDINNITNEIIQLKNQIETNIIEIGKRLIQVKQSLPHGHFTMFLEERVDFTRQTANKFMKIADEFTNSKATLHLGTEKLYILTTIPKIDRENFIQENDVEQMSTRQLKQAVKGMKKEHRKSTESPKTDNGSVPVEDKTHMASIDNINTKENAMSVNTQIQNIWEDTQKILDEILLRTGKFYADDNLNLNDKENLLLSRYIAKEITYSQLKETIEQNKLNIPFIFNEEAYKKYIEDLNINNSYGHYVDIYDSKNKEDNSYIYYDVVLSKSLSYSEVVEKMYAIELGETEETRQKWVKEDDYLFIDGKYTVDMGSDDFIDYICVYKDKELLGHYDIKSDDYYEDIEKLFDFYKINEKYLKLVDKFTEQLEKDRLEQQKRAYDNTVKRARFKYIMENETYLLLHCNDGTDYIKVFKGYEKVCSYVFDTGMNLYNSEFYNAVCMGKFVNELIKEANENNHTVLVHILKFRKVLRAEAKKTYDAWKKKYDNFNWGNFEFKKPKQEVSIDIFNSEELQFLKDMLVDKDLWRKVYTKTAVKVHPDRVANKGQESIKEAEAKMKLLNAVNEKIKGIAM